MSVEKTKYSLTTQAAYVFIGKSASFVLAIFIPIILVRIFSKESYGIYQQMILISMFLVDILKWGLINSLYYFFPQEDNKRTELLSQTFYLLATIGFICIPIVFILRYLIADLFNSPIFATLVFPISLYFLFMLISLILDSLFILEKKSKIVVIYEITNKTLRAFFVIGAAILFKNVNSVFPAFGCFPV